jgi:hypothetical protein
MKIQSLCALGLLFFFSGAGGAQAQDVDIVDSLRLVMPNGYMPRYTADDVEKIRSMVDRLKANRTYYLGVYATHSDVQWRGYKPKESWALNGGLSAGRTASVIEKLLLAGGMSKKEIGDRVRSYQMRGQVGPDRRPYVDIILAEDDNLKELFARRMRAEIEEVPQSRGHIGTAVALVRKEYNVILDITANYHNGWDAHQTPGYDGTGIIPTIGAGIAWADRGAVFCKIQPPGSVFENEGGGLNIAELSLLVKAIGPVCATVSYENYVHRNEENHARVAQDLVFKERAKGIAVGTHVNLMKKDAPGDGLGAGGRIMFIDRQYDLPPRWTIDEGGKVEVHLYVSYGLTVFSF